jgi:hypothetical protein
MFKKKKKVEFGPKSNFLTKKIRNEIDALKIWNGYNSSRLP